VFVAALGRDPRYFDGIIRSMSKSGHRPTDQSLGDVILVVSRTSFVGPALIVTSVA
jgi:hypothetical protein